MQPLRAVAAVFYLICLTNVSALNVRLAGNGVAAGLNVPAPGRDEVRHGLQGASNFIKEHASKLNPKQLVARGGRRGNSRPLPPQAIPLTKRLGKVSHPND